MYSRSLASFFFILAFFFVTLLPTATALPAEPGRTVGQVVAENHNMACRMYACWNKETGSNSTAATADAAANSTESPATESNAASSLYQYGALLPALVAGSSLFLLV